MADTVRTKTALLALLPLNVTKDIGPQDVRDAIVSIMGTGYGGMGYAAITNTAQGLTTSWQTITGRDTLTPADPNAIVVASLGGNFISLNADGIYVVVWACSFTLNNIKTVDMRITHSGVQIPGAIGQRDLAAGGDVESFCMVGIASATAGDTIEGQMKIDTATSTIDGISGNLLAFKIG